MIKIARLGVAAAIVVATIVGVSSCGRSETSKNTVGSALMACDATFANVMEQEVEVFQVKYKPATILDFYMDESAAIDSLLNPNNNFRLAVAARPLSPKEKDYIKKTKRTPREQAIAVDAVALIVNPENPIEYLSHDDLVQILSGEYTTWDKFVADGDKLGKVTVVFDGAKSSTVHYMRDSLLNGAELGPNVATVESPKEVFETVARMKNAIGVIGVSWLTSDLNGRALTSEELAQVAENSDAVNMAEFNPDVKVLPIQPRNSMTYYYPTQENIYLGTYPYYRQIYLISTGTPHSVAHSFYVFVTSVVGQKLLVMTGVCPKVITPQLVETSR